jgi:hypothetical protein
MACLIHAIEKSLKVSTLLSNLGGIEYYIETKIFDSELQIFSNVNFFIFLLLWIRFAKGSECCYS